MSCAAYRSPVEKMCTVVSKLESLSIGWNDVSRSFQDTKLGLVNFSPDRLITLSMTVTATTNSYAVSTEKIYDVLAQKQSYFAVHPKIVKITPKMRRPRCKFRNSASLYYKGPYPGQKGVKIFQNGRLHVTGSHTSTEVSLFAFPSGHTDAACSSLDVLCS